jgi:2-dehydro-3-deoxygluconokinase
MDNPKKVICFGEIMMRLNTPFHQRFLQTSAWEIFYGGSEANVSVLLAQLKIPTAFVSRLPLNPLGQAALDAVRHHGVEIGHSVRGEDRLGLYFTETSNSLRPSRVIYDRTDSAFARLEPGMIDWDVIFKTASWFHWSGISAAVSASAAATCLEALKAARKAGLHISADLNYRSMLWKWGKHPSEVMPELLSYCDFITGDIDTAEIYFGIVPDKTLPRMEALKACGKSLKEKIPGLHYLAMSFRETNDGGNQRYSGVLIGPDTVHESGVHDFGNIVERIGSGDAFMACLIYGMIKGHEAGRVIDFAVAAGALKHSIPGEFTLLTVEEIENFLAQGNARGRIIR